jgi:hypothetical protein
LVKVKIKSKSSLTLLLLRRGLFWLRQNKKAPPFAKGGILLLILNNTKPTIIDEAIVT